MNISKRKTIKTSFNYWVQEIGTVILFAVIFPIFAISYWGPRSYFIGGLAIICGIIYLFRDFRPAYNAQILFTPLEITGKVKGFTFVELWTDIKAVAFSGQGTTSLLTIATENNILQISSRFFDRKELEKELRAHLPSEVFDPLAFQRLTQVQRFEQERKRQFDNLYEPLKVSVGKLGKIIGSISLLFCAFMLSLLIFPINKTGPLVLAAIFGGLGLVLIVFSIGTIEANRETIVLRMIFREYELSWNTLREVYINLQNHTIVLTGDKCRILLPSTTSWSGKDREQLYELVRIKIENTGIQPKQGTKPLYWRSKNF